MTNNQAVLSGIMIVAGIGIPIMAATNAGLAGRIGAPMAAVSILSLATLISALALTSVFETPDFSALSKTPPGYFLAGILFVFYIGAITIAAPKIGLGNAVFMVLFGQLLSAAAIDHFGLFGSQVFALTPRRTLGILVMAFGVYLARPEFTQHTNGL